MSYKICTKCHKNKHKAKSFFKDKTKLGGYYSSCKDCYRERIGSVKRMPREKKRRNNEIVRRCSTCKEYKSREKFYRNPSSLDGIHQDCKYCSIKYSTSKLSKERNKTRRQRNRMLVLQFYGGDKPKCNCCGESIYEFLCIDHIDGGGNKHRKSLSGGHFYRWLIRNNFPSGFQILCHNCNMAKGFYGRCPHKIKNQRG